MVLRHARRWRSLVGMAAARVNSLGVRGLARAATTRDVGSCMCSALVRVVWHHVTLVQCSRFVHNIARPSAISSYTTPLQVMGSLGACDGLVRRTHACLQLTLTPAHRCALPREARATTREANSCGACIRFIAWRVRERRACGSRPASACRGLRSAHACSCVQGVHLPQWRVPRALLISSHRLGGVQCFGGRSLVVLRDAGRWLLLVGVAMQHACALDARSLMRVALSCNVLGTQRSSTRITVPHRLPCIARTEATRVLRALARATGSLGVAYQALCASACSMLPRAALVRRRRYSIQPVRHPALTPALVRCARLVSRITSAHSL